MKTSHTKIYPVIHFANEALALLNAERAFDTGCAGVFLIHMEGQDSLLEPVALKIKAQWPGKAVGINYLGMSALEGLQRNLAAGLDMTWTDDAGLHTAENLERAETLGALLRKYPEHEFFGAAAFKYQTPEPDPASAAQRGNALGMIATTSGAATGQAADLEKIRLMSKAVGGKLAVASGITPENVASYRPYVSHILVATGVSSDFYELDAEKLFLLVGRAHA